MKILLIDNSDSQLLELKEALVNSSANVAYVTHLNAGITTLSEHKFTVVICAATVSKNDGNTILEMISNKFPTIVRILITEHQTQAQHNAHHTFSLPLQCNSIVSTIEQLAINIKAITKDIIVKTVANLKTLPSPPNVYFQLNEALKSPNSDSANIAEIIQQDPALTAKVLQFSNNTFASSNKPMLSISDAITKMGIDTLCCIVMTAELFAYNPKIKNFSILDEQLHCLATAKLAASMVSPELKQDAMIAGLLHDIGKMVLFEINQRSTEMFFKARVSNNDNTDLENKIFASDHCHVGGYLLHMWGFSYHIIEAVVLHHRPKKLLSDKFSVAQAVYLANVLIHKQQPSAEFISHFNLADKIEKLSNKARSML